MANKRWNVWRVDLPATGHPRIPDDLRKLGRVSAPNSARALLIAFKKWPEECDPKQVQAGMIVRQMRTKRSKPSEPSPA